MSFFPKRPHEVKGVANAVLYYNEVEAQPEVDAFANLVLMNWTLMNPQKVALWIIEQGWDEIQLIYLSTKFTPSMNREIRRAMNELEGR